MGLRARPITSEVLDEHDALRKTATESSNWGLTSAAPMVAWMDTLVADDAAMVSRIREMKSVLEFYARPETYEEPVHEYRDVDGHPRRNYGSPPIERNSGARARAVLDHVRNDMQGTE